MKLICRNKFNDNNKQAENKKAESKTKKKQEIKPHQQLFGKNND